MLPPQCIVVEKLNTDIILGVDFLRAYGGVIDLRKSLISFEETDSIEIPLVHEKILRTMNQGREDPMEIWPQ